MTQELLRKVIKWANDRLELIDSYAPEFGDDGAETTNELLAEASYEAQTTVLHDLLDFLESL